MVFITEQTPRLVDDVIVVSHYIDDLVVILGDDRLLKSHNVRLKLSEAVDEHGSAIFPACRPSKEVECEDAQVGLTGWKVSSRG